MNEAVFARHQKLSQTNRLALFFYILYRRLVEQGPALTFLWIEDKVLRNLIGASPPHISQVMPRLFVGGQHRRHGLPKMREWGIGAIVNLREEFDDAEHGLALEHYLWLPTTDDTPPTFEALDRGAAFIAEQIDAGRGVYIHCASGVGRAPTMAAAYLITQGMDAESAWRQIQQGRPFGRPTPTQLEVIDAFAARTHR